MLESIAKLASKHGIAPLKRYGQNFIFDETLCDKITRSADINADSSVLEIGPGPAGLSRSILKLSPKRLVVIETDLRCLPLLEEIKSHYPFLEIMHQDALKVSLDSISQERFDIVSNLPYNIGTKLLTNWLQQISYVNSITIMLQKEVVDRIIAKPGSKDYGRLSVICQITCDVYKCFDVSPQAFYPPPKIWSSVVRLVPKSKPIASEIVAKLEQVTHYAFIARRKMLKSALQPLFPDVTSSLSSMGIDSQLRAENLAPIDYLKIASLI